MKKVQLAAMVLFLIAPAILRAQKTADSLRVVKAMKELLAICKSAGGGPNTSSDGLFSKAAPYIVYHGDDKKRAWKEFSDYTLQEDRKGVDEMCASINETIGGDADYRVVKYKTEKESEGVWHILSVTYKVKGVKKNANYAFLKINDRFGLGDID